MDADRGDMMVIVRFALSLYILLSFLHLLVPICSGGKCDIGDPTYEAHEMKPRTLAHGLRKAEHDPDHVMPLTPNERPRKASVTITRG